MASPRLHKINASAPLAIAKASLRGFHPVTSILGAVNSLSSSPLPIQINLASGTSSAILLKAAAVSERRHGQA